MTPDTSVSPIEAQTLWLYADTSNQPTGPFPFDELRRLAAVGTIRPETWIIENGGSQWRTFADVSATLPPPFPSKSTPPGSTTAKQPRRWPTILALFLLYPLGLILLCYNKAFSRRAKIAWGTTFGLLFLLAVLSPHPTPASPTKRTATTASAQNTADTKRTFHESDFAYIFTGLDDYRTVGDAGVCNLAGLVGAIYDGAATIKQASRYAFRITAVDADFKRVVGDYLLYAAVTPQGKTVEFAMRRDPAYEREQLKHYKSLEDFYAENKGALSSGDQLRQGEVVIVDAEQFATESGVVRQIPVVRCVRIESSPRENRKSASNAPAIAADRVSETDYRRALNDLYRELLENGLSGRRQVVWLQEVRALYEMKKANGHGRSAAGFLMQLGTQYSDITGGIADTQLTRFYRKNIDDYLQSPVESTP